MKQVIIFMYVCLSVILSLCLSVSLSLFLSVSLSICLSRSLCLSVSLGLSVSLSLYLSVSLSQPFSQDGQNLDQKLSVGNNIDQKAFGFFCKYFFGAPHLATFILNILIVCM